MWQQRSVSPFAERIDAIDPDICAALDQVSLGATFFGSLAWFALLARTAMLPGTQARFLVLWKNDGGEPMCMPFLRKVAGVVRRTEALSNFYSCLFEPVARPAATHELAIEFSRYLQRMRPGTDVVDLRPLDAQSGFFREMQQALADNGFWTDTYFCFGNWYLELAGQDFAAYFQTRPSQLRNTWRRARKKLEQRSLKIEIVSENSARLDAAIANYEAIYNSSWKHPEPFPDFIPGMCRMAADRGWLRLGVLSLDGQAVAAQIWFVKDGIASIFKLAYIEEYAKQSVGTVLTAELMRHTIDEDKVAVVDYLSGDDAYKKDWMSHRRERLGIVAFNKRRPLGVLAAARHFGARVLKGFRTAPATRQAVPARCAAIETP